MKTLFLSLAALVAVTFARAQDKGYNDKDEKKATELAEQDRDYKGLTDEEKQKVIENIALQIHGRRRKARQAMIVTRKGTKVEDLEKLDGRSGYKLVSASQDKEATEVAPQTNWETHEIQTPDLGKLFADNKSTIDEGSEDAAALNRQIQSLVETLKKTNGRLVSVHIESSASTLPNTREAAKLTHLQLSQKRAESAADFVTKKLADSGIVLQDDQITMDYTGGNGNGTTGPSSPFPAIDPLQNAQGSCSAPQEILDAIKKNEPDATLRPKIAKVYDQYKFVSVSFVVANEVAEVKPGSSTPGEAHAVLVHVDFKEKRKFHWPRISLNIHWPKSHRNWGSTACPKFH